MANFDYINEKVPIETPFNRKRRTCRRCGIIWWTTEMKRVGERYYCNPCYDPPSPPNKGDRR